MPFTINIGDRCGYPFVERRGGKADWREDLVRFSAQEAVRMINLAFSERRTRRNQAPSFGGTRLSGQKQQLLLCCSVAAFPLVLLVGPLCPNPWRRRPHGAEV